MTPEERLAAFRQFVEKSPAEPFPRYSLAMQLRAMGRVEEATAELRELMKRSPDYVATYLILAQLLEEAARWGEAANVYEAGIAAASRAGNDHARSELSRALGSLRAHGEGR